jgi:hypothetical protein
MIHPEYIKAFFDTYSAKFLITKFKDEYTFMLCFYSDNAQLLYKIKDRFKNGKVIDLSSRTYILKISKQLDPVIAFINKNRPYNTPAQIEFLRWAYLYRKLITEKDLIKSDKELRRINRRLDYFKIAR